jgi:hypothetical protein
LDIIRTLSFLAVSNRRKGRLKQNLHPVRSPGDRLGAISG